MDSRPLRQRKLQRWGALKSERSTWDNRAREISELLLPFSGRFTSTDRNRGDKSFNNILDSTATRALGILSAGLMAGMTSPARPWFRLAVADEEAMENGNVKTWLNDLTNLMRNIFARSNTYRALHSMYEELGGFATSANIIDDNFEKVLWNTPLTWGEFALSTDKLGRVNSLYREFDMTVANIVGEFGNVNPKSGSIDWSNISVSVKNLWDQGKAYDQWVPILHAIEPRAFSDREYGRSDQKNMHFSSCYFELNGNEEKTLRESGYKDFPVLGVRWHTRGRDIYGNGPSMVALGDIKQLQHEQLRKGQGIDYMTLPPIAIPGELSGREVDSLPGGVTAIGLSATGSKIQNLFDVRLDLSHLLADINDVRARINQAYYADLFLMITNMPGVQPRNVAEIAERHEEKLLMLGPVLERLHDEMLSELIDITFTKIVDAGILPPPPQELQGQDLKVEFVSMLAQAQRAVGLGSVDRLIGTVTLVAQGSGDMSAWDKVDKDQVIDKYSDMLAVDPSLIVTDDKIVLVRSERAKQQRAAQMAEHAPAMAQAAKNLSETNTKDKNALTDLTRQFSGYS